jgi:hypothetical protein
MKNLLKILMSAFTFIIFSTLVMFGCSNLTQKNYNELSLGMDYEEVVEILGKPDECKSVLNARNCIWEDSAKSITVQLVADKVVFLSNKGLK